MFRSMEVAEMTGNLCVCGHTEGTNMADCERCQLIARIRKLMTLAENSRIVCDLGGLPWKYSEHDEFSKARSTCWKILEEIGL